MKVTTFYRSYRSIYIHEEASGRWIRSLASRTWTPRSALRRGERRRKRRRRMGKKCMIIVFVVMGFHLAPALQQQPELLDSEELLDRCMSEAQDLPQMVPKILGEKVDGDQRTSNDSRLREHPHPPMKRGRKRIGNSVKVADKNFGKRIWPRTPMRKWSSFMGGKVRDESELPEGMIPVDLEFEQGVAEAGEELGVNYTPGNVEGRFIERGLGDGNGKEGRERGIIAENTPSDNPGGSAVEKRWKGLRETGSKYPQRIKSNGLKTSETAFPNSVLKGSSSASAAGETGGKERLKDLRIRRRKTKRRKHNERSEQGSAGADRNLNSKNVSVDYAKRNEEEAKVENLEDSKKRKVKFENRKHPWILGGRNPEGIPWTISGAGLEIPAISLNGGEKQFEISALDAEIEGGLNSDTLIARSEVEADAKEDDVGDSVRAREEERAAKRKRSNKKRKNERNKKRENSTLNEEAREDAGRLGDGGASSGCENSVEGEKIFEPKEPIQITDLLVKPDVLKPDNTSPDLMSDPILLSDPGSSRGTKTVGVLPVPREKSNSAKSSLAYHLGGDWRNDNYGPPKPVGYIERRETLPRTKNSDFDPKVKNNVLGVENILAKILQRIIEKRRRDYGRKWDRGTRRGLHRQQHPYLDQDEYIEW